MYKGIIKNFYLWKKFNEKLYSVDKWNKINSVNVCLNWISEQSIYQYKKLKFGDWINQFGKIKLYIYIYNIYRIINCTSKSPASIIPIHM